MTTTQDNPGRPPKHWMRRCIKGVRSGKSATDPGAVCGSLWHHKLSDAQRREILKEERAGGGLVENPIERRSATQIKQEVLDFLAELSHDDRLGIRGGGHKTETVRRAARQVLAGDMRGRDVIVRESGRIAYGGTIGRAMKHSAASAITIAEVIEQTPDSAVVKYRRSELDPYYDMHGRFIEKSGTLHNPSDAYKTWLMGVRRQLQRTGYPEAAGRLPKHDRDLRGVYLSGASAGDAARVVGEAYRRGDFAENPVGTGGVLLAVGAVLGVGAIVYYLATREKKEEKPATSFTKPGGGPLVPPPSPPCVIDAGKLQVFAQSKGMLAVSLPACPPSAPPVQNQPAPPAVPCWDDPKAPAWAALWAVLGTAAPTVPVLLALRDGTLWTYGGSPPLPMRRDDLRAEYCAFAAGSFTPVTTPVINYQFAQGDPASLFIL